MNKKIELKELIKDLERNKELLNSDSSQFHRRNYLRSLFSLFEASLSNLREDVATRLNYKMFSQEQFSINEFIPLLDEDVQLQGNGEINLVPNKYPFKNLVAYVFKKYAELISENYNPLSNHKWNSFKSAIKIRNRVTHPTDHDDANISDNELNLIFEAEEWWKECVNKISSNA
jgi:hypothetical protein